MMKGYRTNLFAAAAVAGLVGTGAAVRWEFSQAHAAPPVGALPVPAAPIANTMTENISDVAESVVQSVVTISTEQTVHSRRSQIDDPMFTDPRSPLYQGGGQGGDAGDQKVGALGSGVIVTAGGRILTNAHVVKGADEITVSLDDGNDYDAKVVGIDPKTDVAVIQLQGKFPALHPIRMGNSGSLRLGEVVLAVGNPLGVGKSVTMGIISAKGRGGRGIVGYADFIQTDAAINQGNSGGALVNMHGELVGINTAIISQSGGYQGIGYAIPTSMAKPIMDMLVADGKVVRGYLGVNIQTVTQKLAKTQQLGAEHGALVAGVMPGTPAAQAGLTEGDVITQINGTTISSSETLMNTIALLHPGTVITLAVASPDARTKTVRAKLGELPDDTSARAGAGTADEPADSDDSDDGAGGAGARDVPAPRMQRHR